MLFWVSVLIVLISGAFVQEKNSIRKGRLKTEAVLGVKHYDLLPSLAMTGICWGNYASILFRGYKVNQQTSGFSLHT